jgi:hypothetical protein
MRITTTTAIGALLLMAATPGWAQSQDPYFATASGNYDLVYHETGQTSGVGGHFDIAATVKRDVPFLGIMGEIGVNQFDTGTVSDYMGGARLRLPNAGLRVLPFAQFLLGLYHCGSCNINDFAIQGGGGLDFKLISDNDIRIRVQVDVRHVFDDVQGFSPVRVSAGVVFPLNR